MSDQQRHPSPETLKNYHPLDRLDEIQRELLARALEIHSAGKGTTLIQEARYERPTTE